MFRSLDIFVSTAKELEGLIVMSGKKEGPDIFQMLYERAEKKREERARLLESLGVKEYFNQGSIRINKGTCQGVECRLCIKACPTYALYWEHGEVKVIEDLCVYCTACVLKCIVDNCIQITRKRSRGTMERCGTPSEVLKLLGKINSEKRLGVTNRRFPSVEKYLQNLLK